MSLSGIVELKSAFPNAEIGFSDHSIGPTMALAGVALGAVIIERHFTLSRFLKGPDIACSMDPSELRFLIDRSIEVHVALMNKKQRSIEEEAVYKFARSSVVADRDILAGSEITEADIWTRRPGSGEIPGYDYDKVLGKKLISDLKKNQQIKWSDLT